MTKRVRIENADTANHKVIVEIWDKAPDPLPGEPSQSDRLASTITLASPCDMTGLDVYLTSTRYLVIKEG